MATVGGLSEAAPVSRAAVLEARYRDRLPATSWTSSSAPAAAPSSFPGISRGLAWTVFDVDRPPLCASMYQVVMTEGLREDLAAYLNRGLLVRHWPMLRTVVGRVIRDVWEAAFPELIEGLPARS